MIMRPLRWLLLTMLAIAGVLLLWALAGRTGDRPLDLGARPDRTTGPRLVALRDSFPRCRALLRRAGVMFEALPARREGATCGYDDAVRLGVGGSRRIVLEPLNIGMSCPTAAALAMWEWDVVQPAALRHFGQPIARIEHFGGYNCRRIAGRDAATWSEHATANAIDIAAFRLRDGRRVSVVNDWQGKGADARFLREVRDGACPLFATVLSPDYNAAHRDHFHFDQKRRAWGGRACR